MWSGGFFDKAALNLKDCASAFRKDEDEIQNFRQMNPKRGTENILML